MTFADIKALLAQKFGPEIILGEETTGLQSALIIAPESIAEVCLELRDNPETYFDFLSNLSGVDYGAEDGGFGVVYHLASIPYNLQLVLKVSEPNAASPAAASPAAASPAASLAGTARRGIDPGSGARIEPPRWPPSPRRAAAIMFDGAAATAQSSHCARE